MLFYLSLCLFYTQRLLYNASHFANCKFQCVDNTNRYIVYWLFQFRSNNIQRYFHGLKVSKKKNFFRNSNFDSNNLNHSKFLKIQFSEFPKTTFNSKISKKNVFLKMQRFYEKIFRIENFEIRKIISEIISKKIEFVP